MINAWNEIAAYVADNAHNPRKGYRLKDLTNKEQLHLSGVEMLELIASPDAIDEMADVLACLFHYCMRKGWTIHMLEAEIGRKLALRFPETAFKLAARNSPAKVGFGRHQDAPLPGSTLGNSLEEGNWIQDGHGFGHPRTKRDVLEARKNAVGGGCCNRFADNMACDCLENAAEDL